MCKEVLYLVEDMDMDSINLQIALQCAPVITGIKISNLLITLNGNEREIQELLSGTGISYYKLKEIPGRVVYLLFNFNKLYDYLNRADIKVFMNRFGYIGMSMSSTLRRFGKRYSEYSPKSDNFPHELGIILGYPLEDVQGFIDNDGKNYLFSGYWKVYRNVPEKKRLFNSYEEAQSKLVKELLKYGNMKAVIEQYGKGKMISA